MRYLIYCLLLGACGSAFPFSNDSNIRTFNKCECGIRNQNRIVGGSEAGENEYPFMALVVERSNGFPFCGGSIITPMHVLTASHCTFENGLMKIRMSVRVGEHDYTKQSANTQIHHVSRAIEHAGYEPSTLKNDIAILVLETKIEFNSFASAVCMPPPSVNLVNQKITAMGWGLTSAGGKPSAALTHVSLTVINKSTCKMYWGARLQADNSQLCTLDTDIGICQGDSGGPFVWVDPATNRWTQVGLTSFARHCGDSFPSVQTKLSFYLDWIRKNIEGSGVTFCSNY